MLGLVLEGGANRTYYTIGVIDALIDNKIECDVLVGVSAGIANGISYASGQRGRGMELGERYVSDKRYMGAKYYFKKGNRSYYNIDFVFKEIPEKIVPFDYEAFKKFPGKVYAVVTNVRTGKSEYLPVDDYEKSWKIVLASCALPLMFRPVEIDGEKYMDGGCSDPLPVEFAYRIGCDKVICVLTREREYTKESGGEAAFSSFIFRKNKAFSNVLKNRGDIYNNSRKFIFKKEKEGSAFVFSPKNTSGWKRTEKRTEFLRKMYEEGYQDAMLRMNELKEFIKY